MKSFLLMAPLVYMAKAILISALFSGYYWLFLRNRRYHHFNRFYLLAAACLSAILPVLQIPLTIRLWEPDTVATGFGTLHTILPGEWKELTGAGQVEGPHLSGIEWQQAAVFGLAIISLWLISRLVIHVIRILGLRSRYPYIYKEGVRLFLTTEPAAPFSFFRNIYWDHRLDVESCGGKQIFQHELNHVRQGHSFDLLALEAIRRILWANPFFHLLYRELRIVHEFLADGYAISEDRCGADRFAYAEMLVWLSMRGQDHSGASLPAHSFFQSPIKRRITMITQSGITSPRKLSRVLAAPLAFLVFCAFTFRLHAPAGKGPEKELTVVIDPAHGGIDNGAVNKEGVAEKNIALAISQRIKQLAPAYKVHVILTREDDRLPGDRSTIQDALHYRSELANKNGADLFISVHVDNIDADTSNSFSVYVSKDNPHYTQSTQLGSALIDELKQTFTSGGVLKQREEHIWVLRSTTMPAVLIECGNINSGKDVAFVQSADGQEKIARNILQGIVKYGTEGGQ
jgi:N-acetylmuramoyl-L-alanine amidase